MYKIQVEQGYYIFKLESVLIERGISKNKVMRDLNIDFMVIQRLIYGDLTRLDITVLAKFCDYLNCGICDIVEYVYGGQ